MGTLVILALLLAVIAYQLFVTVRVVRSDQYSSTQRIVQAILIWLVPLVGAVICHVVLFTDRQSPQRRDDNFVPATDNNPPGIGQDVVHH